MRFGSYRFECRFDSPARLPAYKGSMFRGAFGHALKRTVCALRRQQCPECLLRTQCLYPLVFETHLALPPPDTPGAAAPPHPFVIEPPDTERADFNTGDPFDLGLLLFGAVNDSLPYFVYTVEAMGAAGVGARVSGRRGRFSVDRVTCREESIYTSREGRLKTGDHAVDLTLERGPQQGVTGLAVRFHTPFRGKQNGRLARELPFEVLVRAMLRRAASLMSCYGGGEPDLDYRELAASAGRVRVAGSTLGWVDRRRYSSRQEQAMMIGGLIGGVTYQGDLAPFIPLVDFCSVVHIGKQTTFGMGRFTSERRP